MAPVEEEQIRSGGRRRLALLAVFVLASRLPWIGVDYGGDPDSYRVVNAARQIAATGHYVESRLPGYPVQEYAVALVVGGGPLVSNGLTALLSVVAFVFLALILSKMGIRGFLLGSAAFALTPVVYVSSTSSIDYVWAVAFVLGATYFVLLERSLLAGLFLGLAIGCRLTSGAMLLPLGLFLLLARPALRRARQVAAFAATSLAVGGFCFVPVWARHGASFFSFKEPVAYPGLLSVVLRATTGVWGTVGTIAWLVVGVGLLVSARSGSPLPSDASKRCVFFICASVVGLYGIAYLRLPLEAGYLMPVVPFALIGAGLILPRPLFRALCLALCISAVVDLGRSGVSFGGQLVADHLARVQDSRDARAAIDVVSGLGERAILFCGSTQPRILASLSSDALEKDHYLYLMEDRRDYQKYAAAGYEVRFLPEAEAENLARYGIDLRALGAKELVPRR